MTEWGFEFGCLWSLSPTLATMLPWVGQWSIHSCIPEDGQLEMLVKRKEEEGWSIEQGDEHIWQLISFPFLGRISCREIQHDFFDGAKGRTAGCEWKPGPRTRRKGKQTRCPRRWVDNKTMNWMNERTNEWYLHAIDSRDIKWSLKHLLNYLFVCPV